MKKMTHWGIIEGCDDRTPDGTQYKARLRETKLFWITEKGTKYSKKFYGNLAGEAWPMYSLQLESIKPLSHSNVDPSANDGGGNVK